MPTPVSRAFRAYQDGIQQRYKVTYPPSARANGQIAQLIARLGIDGALGVIGWYLASDKDYYRNTKHGLPAMVKDCEILHLQLQERAQWSGKPPDHAEVYLLQAAGKERRLDDFPLGEPMQIARKATATYARMIAEWKATQVRVHIGTTRSIYTVEEARA